MLIRNLGLSTFVRGKTLQARDELVTEDLVAYRAPLVQVLSLSRPVLERCGGGLVHFGEMLRSLAGAPPDTDSRRSR